MTRFQKIWTAIALSQIILGLLFLIVPGFMQTTMGVPDPGHGNQYPLAMFAARLLVMGMVMAATWRHVSQQGPWIWGMIAIQLIDLAAGMVYSALGVVAWRAALFPMVNAALFSLLLVWLKPPCSRSAQA